MRPPVRPSLFSRRLLRRLRDADLLRLRLLLAAIIGIAGCNNGHEGSASNSATGAAPSTVSQTPSCGERVIRRDGIGKLKLGMRADSVKSVCHVAVDTVRPGPEGMSQRVMLVAFPPDAVEAEIVNDSVWRLDIKTPGIQTADSIGVGSPLRKLLQRDDPQGLIGEGNFVVVYRRQCGLSFVLRGGIPAGRPRTWNKPDLLTLPQDLPVERVLVFRCAPDATSG